MSRKVTVAATQMACTWEVEQNVDRAEKLVRQAAGQGAQIVLIQELFDTPYFCQDQKARALRPRPAAGGPPDPRAHEEAGGRARGRAAGLAASSGPNNAFYNSLVIVDADGRELGRLPQEPHPRRAGLSGEVLLQSRRHRLQGLGHALCAASASAICWDQWFPEAARAMALQGAELLFYPDRHRLRAAGPGHRHARTTGSAPCRAMPRPT